MYSFNKSRTKCPVHCGESSPGSGVEPAFRTNPGNRFHFPQNQASQIALWYGSNKDPESTHQLLSGHRQ